MICDRRSGEEIHPQLRRTNMRMNLSPSLFCRSIVALWSVVLTSTLVAQPSAEEIIAGAKMVAVLQQADLQGKMTKGSAQVPTALFLRQNDIQFQYFENQQWSKFHLRLKDEACEIFQMKAGKQTPFPLDQIAKPIAGMDLSYEDLALRFFYWKNPQLEGEERVGVHPCWKIRLNNPGQGGAYQVMYVWIHQKYGAFMKIEGFNRAGQILKRFEVTDVMKIGKNASGHDIYTLKQMNVSSMNPANGRTASQTKLIFEAPKSVELKGPR